MDVNEGHRTYINRLGDITPEFVEDTGDNWEQATEFVVLRDTSFRGSGGVITVGQRDMGSNSNQFRHHYYSPREARMIAQALVECATEMEQIRAVRDQAERTFTEPKWTRISAGIYETDQFRITKSPHRWGNWSLTTKSGQDLGRFRTLDEAKRQVHDQLLHQHTQSCLENA